LQPSVRLHSHAHPQANTVTGAKLLASDAGQFYSSELQTHCASIVAASSLISITTSVTQPIYGYQVVCCMCRGWIPTYLCPSISILPTPANHDSSTPVLIQAKGLSMEESRGLCSASLLEVLKVMVVNSELRQVSLCYVCMVLQAEPRISQTLAG